MSRTFHLLLICLLCATASAQTRQINNLKRQRKELEQGIKHSQGRLNQTRHDVGRKQQDVDFIEEQLQQRLTYIRQLEVEIDSLDRNIDTLTAEVERQQHELEMRRQKFRTAIRMDRQVKGADSPLLFILSGRTFPQMLRRQRYAREHAASLRASGLRIMATQDRLRYLRNQLLAAKGERSGRMDEVIIQRRELTRGHAVESARLKQLQRQASDIQRDMTEQTKQLKALDKKIDELVAIEVEKARRRAEEEARRKREAEARRQAAKAAASKGKKSGSSTSSGGSTTPSQAPTRWLTAEDRQLNGSMQQNKGRLPVPITGPYRIYRRFGLNRVAPGVTLDNKGLHYMGQSGARARSIWDGEVSAIFQLAGTKHVLVRHGSYISVYSGLSSVIVQKNQKLHTRDIIGTVANGDQDQPVLQFQLRHETSKLNPEQWIGR